MTVLSELSTVLLVFCSLFLGNPNEYAGLKSLVILEVIIVTGVLPPNPKGNPEGIPFSTSSLFSS